MTPKELEVITAAVDAAIHFGWYPVVAYVENRIAAFPIPTTPTIVSLLEELNDEVLLKFQGSGKREAYLRVSPGREDIITHITQTPVFYEAVSSAIRKVNELCR